MKRKGGDVEMEKIRAIVDRQESRKETGMFLLFLGESLFVFSYFMKMSDFLFGMGLYQYPFKNYNPGDEPQKRT